MGRADRWDKDEKDRDWFAKNGGTGKLFIFLFGLCLGNLVGFILAGAVFLTGR